VCVAVCVCAVCLCAVGVTVLLFVCWCVRGHELWLRGHNYKLSSKAELSASTELSWPIELT
jgi:hypothetical protein